MTRLKALRSLRWNYKRRGVWVWLKGRQRCRRCKGQGEVFDRAGWLRISCPVCRRACRVRGYRRILTEPNRVITEQSALAEGAFA